MKLRAMLGTAVFVGGIVVIGTQVVSQDQERAGQPGEQMMQGWMKYAQPGKFHAHLEPLVGR